MAAERGQRVKAFRGDKKRRTADAGNNFINDGSFLEMFRQRMEERPLGPGPANSSFASRFVSVATQASSQSSRPSSYSEGKQEEPVAKVEAEAPCYTTQTICYKEGASVKKPQYQVTSLLPVCSIQNPLGGGASLGSQWVFH